MHRVFPGYPPADHEARDFLAAKDTEAKSYHRACCFIDALFQHTYNTLKEKFNSQWGVQTVAQEFRMRMTAGQKMKNHNEFRIQFYRRVVQIAKELMAKDVCLSVIYPSTKSIPQGSSLRKRQWTSLHFAPDRFHFVLDGL